MSKFSILLLTLFNSFLLQNCFSSEPIRFTKKKLLVGEKIIDVEIANSPAEIERGLMFRTSLNENQGMLFIFTKEKQLTFWMKNTKIPLSIGYFNKNKELIEVLKMSVEAKSTKDKNLNLYPSTMPAKFALEMKRGWFQRNKIKLGTKFRYLKRVKKKLSTNGIEKKARKFKRPGNEKE